MFNFVDNFVLRCGAGDLPDNTPYNSAFAPTGVGAPVKMKGTVMSKFVTSFLKDESGAAAAEYVLILALVGLAVAAGALILGSSLSGAMSDVAGAVDTKVGAATGG